MSQLYILSHSKKRPYSPGFTLIELLVTLAIVGILAGIAVPQYGEYKKRAFDTVALSALREIVLGEGSYFLDNESYLSCENHGCEILPGISPLNAAIDISIQGSTEKFTGEASHKKGSGRVYAWDSELGGLQ